MSTGKQSVREVVEHADCICIVPVDDQGNILMVKQYRYAIDKDLLEIPAGGVEPGEKPEEAVRREMSEETGFTPAVIRKIGGFYSSPGFCNEYLHLFVGTNLKPNRLIAEDTDAIELVKIKPEEIDNLISSGKICDAKSIAGIYAYLRMRT
jgi:ADP-ribose pyrophosphatase